MKKEGKRKPEDPFVVSIEEALILLRPAMFVKELHSDIVPLFFGGLLICFAISFKNRSEKLKGVRGSETETRGMSGRWRGAFVFWSGEKWRRRNSAFIGPRMQGSVTIQLKSYITVFLGAGGMSFSLLTFCWYGWRTLFSATILI